MTRAPLRMGRATALIALTGLCLTGLSACNKATQDKDRLLSYISATIPLSRTFTYVDADQYKNLTVVGVVEDGFRYKARLSVDGTPTWDEIVSDDAVADRFLRPDILPAVVTKSLGTATPATLARLSTELAASPAPTVSAGSISPIDALRTGRWLVDRTGAPSLMASAGTHLAQADDPIHDALTVLDYVRSAVQAAPFVKKYDPQSLSPVYKPAEDPFPKPARSSGVERFDLAEQALPTPGANGTIAAPSVADFRKMAVYVRDGVVIEVREKIDVVARAAEVARNYHLVVPSGRRLTAGEEVQLVTQLFDRTTVPSGGDPLRVRDMTVQFLDLGQPEAVSLPTDNVVEGSAAILPLHGRGAASTGAGGGGNAFNGGR